MRAFILMAAIAAGATFVSPLSADERLYTPLSVGSFKIAAPACIKCTTRCSQCSNSSQCHDACRRNGNPLVRADSPCGSWYIECRR